MLPPRYYKILLCCLFCFSPFSPLAAQEPLTQTITNASGTLTLRYPTGWQAQEFSEQITLSNGQADINDLTEAVPAGTILLGVGGFPLDEVEGLDANATFDDLLLMVETAFTAPATETDETATPITLESSDELEINGNRTHRFIGNDTLQEWGVWVVDIGNDNVLGLQAITPMNEMSAFIPTIEAIAESAIYVPPPKSLITGRVLWQQTGPVEMESESDSLTAIGDLTIGVDDRIYVSNREKGIVIFTPDGEIQTTLVGDWAKTGTEDIAVAPDGTIWVASGDQQVVHIDAEGNLLAAWEGPFGDDEPQEIELTPEGHIVTFDTISSEDGTTLGRVQIWQTDGRLVYEFLPHDENGDAPFNYSQLAVGPDGSIYLTNFQGIYRFGADGMLLDSQIGAAQLADHSISALVVASDSALIVATYDGVIYHFAADGSYVREFGQAQTDTDPEIDEPIPFVAGEFSAPQGVGILSNGDIVIADTNFDYWQVVKFTFEE